jgi:hypothetical protein
MTMPRLQCLPCHYLVVDGLILTTILVCAASSILCDFSDIKKLTQFNELELEHCMHFSTGQAHERLRYFFQLTFWHLWLATIAYIVIWDMLIRRLLLRNKKTFSLQNVITRILSTFALGIGFIYWSMLGIPAVLLAKQATAFNLINTFGLHFLVLIAALTYYFRRNKFYKNNVEGNEEIDHSDSKSNLYEVCWQYYLIFFYVFAIIFAILSYILQFHLTACVPVYDKVVDWRHPLIAASVCFIVPLIFTSIFFVMHLKNQYTQFLRGFIITFIVACMSFTMSYGFFDNCFHYTAKNTWLISLSITIASSLSAYKFYRSNKDKNFEILFPPLQTSKRLAYDASQPVKCSNDHITDKRVTLS